MSKMTVIQLLNKIANGEEVPKKISYKGDYYYYAGMGSYENYELDDTSLLQAIDYRVSTTLNDEVEDEDEIIEEDKRIKKIESDYYYAGNQTLYEELKDTINKIIDEIYKNKGE